MGMNTRSITLFVVLFAAIVVGMFVFAYLKRQEMQSTMPVNDVTSETQTDAPLVSRVDAKHYFDGTTHTFVGVVEMPTPCDLLNAEAVVQESYPETIVINFTVVNNADTCVQVVTPQRFMVAAAASSEANVKATWGGVPIELNVVPAAPGERPEDFELFIKG